MWGWAVIRTGSEDRLKYNQWPICVTILTDITWFVFEGRAAAMANQHVESIKMDAFARRTNTSTDILTPGGGLCTTTSAPHWGFVTASGTRPLF